MATMPYMPLYVAEHLAETAHLSPIEHHAYLLLVFNYWQRQQPLPPNEKKIRAICRLSEEEWDSARESLREFFSISDTGWNHPKIDSEIKKANEKLEKAIKAGKASAEARLNSRSTDAQQTLNDCSTDVQPLGKVRIGKDKDNISSSILSEDNAQSASPPIKKTKKDSSQEILDELKLVLQDETAEQVIEHRKALKKPLTTLAAKLLAKKLAETQNPNAAAETMIANGWQGFDASWLEKKGFGGSNTQAKPHNPIKFHTKDDWPLGWPPQDYVKECWQNGEWLKGLGESPESLNCKVPRIILQEWKREGLKVADG